MRKHGRDWLWKLRLSLESIASGYRTLLSADSLIKSVLVSDGHDNKLPQI